ncbi:MAG: hypothetical protein FH761_19305 [Firmicutes bacterium]|nr:hypothetical protein [Bacillota bacterium]
MDGTYDFTIIENQLDVMDEQITELQTHVADMSGYIVKEVALIETQNTLLVLLVLSILFLTFKENVKKWIR